MLQWEYLLYILKNFQLLRTEVVCMAFLEQTILYPSRVFLWIKHISYTLVSDYCSDSDAIDKNNNLWMNFTAVMYLGFPSTRCVSLKPYYYNAVVALLCTLSRLQLNYKPQILLFFNPSFKTPNFQDLAHHKALVGQNFNPQFCHNNRVPTYLKATF
jgi:hypothetical protein